ncbi:MAG: LPP20 family lipoprotein [Spirochaetaceae bacterium]|nr:LPP20 family lipoprotein [Spirochaetaceae bacterium]
MVPTLLSQTPDWVQKIPYADDAFFGVGHDGSYDGAMENARQDILMQLSSQVNAVISMEYNSSAEEEQITEKLESYIGSSSLRAAELVDSFEDHGNYWVLLKYCDECGDLFIESALNRYEGEHSYQSQEIMEYIHQGTPAEAVKVERRLDDLNLENYRSEDIQVSMSQGRIVIRVVNFLPDDSLLTPNQERGLKILSKSLFDELEQLNYQSVEIVGHANPTGSANEAAELEMLSMARAQTMADFLEEAGLLVDSISWKGGDELLGDTETSQGRGKNRRVDIFVNFDQGVDHE